MEALIPNIFVLLNKSLLEIESQGRMGRYSSKMREPHEYRVGKGEGPMDIAFIPACTEAGFWVVVI